MSVKDKNTAEMGQVSGYEQQDVNIKRVLFVAFSILVLLIIIVIAMNEYFFAAKEKQIYEFVSAPESADLRQLRAREIEVLHSYKILDVDKGVYQIPIERAMELMAEKAFQAKLEKKAPLPNQF